MMPTPGSAKAATPREIAMYGHSAAILRAWFEKTGMSIGDLNEKLGMPRGHTNIYHWLNAKGGPGPDNRKKLGKIMGVDPASLERRQPGAPGQAVVVRGMAPGAVSERPRPAAEVLTFSVTADGQARIKLDVVLPVTPASAVLRMLLDAGVVMGNTAP
jgi:hypothetical protein